MSRVSQKFVGVREVVAVMRQQDSLERISSTCGQLIDELASGVLDVRGKHVGKITMSTRVDVSQVGILPVIGAEEWVDEFRVAHKVSAEWVSKATRRNEPTVSSSVLQKAHLMTGTS